MNLILFWTLSIFGTHQLVFAQNCKTVSGPSPNSRCVLPFTYNGRTYYECPVDPEDSTKFWCSTQVDQNGNHISNIGAYGHCGSSCPLEGSSRNLPELPRQSNQCYTVGGPILANPAFFRSNGMAELTLDVQLMLITSQRDGVQPKLTTMAIML